MPPDDTRHDNGFSFEHPQTEEELIQLVRKARAEGAQIRVRGSAHGVPGSIYSDAGGHHINVQLDRYTKILKWDEVEPGRRMRVTVQAGCHLGVDPRDPLSNKENSLVWQLDTHGYGWALPDLGGITHQTVAGFLTTGSMGGTLQHDLGAAIVGIRLIDGTGEPRDLAPDPCDPEDEKKNAFYAAGVSMGLLGIVSTVTLECGPRYDVQGLHSTTPTQECPANLFAFDKDGLEGFFRDKKNQYTRLLWWPQQGVDRVELWSAKRSGSVYKQGSTFRRRFEHWRRVTKPRAWQRMRTRRFSRRPFVGTPRFIQRLFVRPFFTYLATEDPLPYNAETRDLVRDSLGLFVRKSKKKEGVTQGKPFRDTWYKALPLDDQISDEHVPTEFTELFIDIADTGRVMRLLSQFFCPAPQDSKGTSASEGMMRTGPYAFEIYPGHKSRFWLSPSHGRHSVRLDVFWFRPGAKDGRSFEADRERFFEQVWELMRKKNINFRVHWGKHLPKADSPAGGVDYLRSQYGMWRKFMAVRQKMDPDGIFLNAYWKEHLGLGARVLPRPPPEPPTSSSALALAPAQSQPRPTQRPFVISLLLLFFRLRRLYFRLRNGGAHQEPSEPARMKNGRIPRLVMQGSRRAAA